VRKQRVRLEDGVHVAPVRREARNVLTADQDAALVGLLEAGNQAERGRLAAPRGAEQGDELAGRDIEVHCVDRDDLVEALA
jgi:hypothetical protein